jgi:dienelactone hydrolase
MKRAVWPGLLGLAIGLILCLSGPAWALGLDPAQTEPILGPAHAKGVIVWSHGRSRNSEDSTAPSPPYLDILRAGGWDVMRFDRLRVEDTLEASSRRLAGYANQLKRKGYRQVVLAGQSFGGFLALMAADASNNVDAVIATAPAAYGQFDDDNDFWRENATRLYPLLASVKRARVMLFYFHGDDFDPGGRGDRSREILAAKHIGYAVVDQPLYLTGHWAASTGLFMRRFGACVRDFADAAGLSKPFDCDPQWGMAPSAALKLPHELIRSAASGGTVAPSAEPATVPSLSLKMWYGFYANGREVLLALESAKADNLVGIYAVGPSVDDKYPASWGRRVGHVTGGDYVFSEAGKNTLRFHPRPDGSLTATWKSNDGKLGLTAQLHQIDPRTLASRETTTAAAQPQ